ncbi:unnamed protein product [Caenorhabditis angaria]|uniref:Alkylglycerol monooxygenase n=1 Tax=Caenorhabditis angaria TaxID=860376 RepID=A0A9P1N2C9_9PELO|nr:unnamed protein product [Caenorhabditis angaria]
MVTVIFVSIFAIIHGGQAASQIGQLNPKRRATTYNTTLIKDTTDLLTGIIDGQDKYFRPINEDNSPLEVEVDISVRSMGPISEQKMEFSLDCYFRQRWIDKRLIFKPIDPNKREIPLASSMLKEIWVPDTYIRNGRSSYLHTLTVPNILLRVRADGQVHVSQRLTIRSRCQMFLKKFPMDTQACPIEIGSLGYFAKDVIYKWKNVDLDKKMGNMLSQYQILNTTRFEEHVKDYRYPDRNISTLKVFFKLQRQQGYYILQIYTPCTLVVVMSWVSFWINKEASPARVSLGIMTVLSMSTIGFGLRTDLPKVSHSTALDVYILSCFGFLFAAMVEYAVINYAQIVYIRKQVHDLKGLEQNSAMRMFTAGLIGARRDTIQVDDLEVEKEEARRAAIPWWKRIWQGEQQGNTSMFYRVAMKAAIAKKTLGNRDPAQVVNRIDAVSQVIFPTLYILYAKNKMNETQWLDRVFSNTSLGHRLLDRLTLTNLRHAFYLISPYETSVESINLVPNYNAEVSAWWLVFLAAEFFILFLSGHDDRFALNDSITSICAGMLSQCFKFSGRAVAIFLYVIVWDNWRILELPWDSPWTWILCLFFQDFMYYLGHRAVHEAGFFWGLHTIHHSSEYYNFSTALRQAAIQDAGLAIYDCIQAFFIPPPIFLVHRYFSEIFQFIMHTSLIDTMGPLGLVFNTPSHHRVHHGRNPYCIDKNYGGVFIIWDKMFNTFEAERSEDPPIYGLVTNENTFNQIYLQFHVVWDMLFLKSRAKNAKGEPIFPGVANKIKAAVFPPGWQPGVPITPFFHWMSMVDPAYGVPEPQKPVVKYNPPIRILVKIYILAYFVLFMAIFFHFEYDRAHLSYLDCTLKIAFFVLTMQCISAFFDAKSYARYLEILRCFLVLIYYAVLLFDHIGAGTHRIFVISIHILAIFLWTADILYEKCSCSKVAEVKEKEKNGVEISVIS